MSIQTGFGDDSQIGAGSLLKYDESNVYDVPEIQEPCSAHSTLPRGIDTSYDDCSGHATPSFSPRYAAAPCFCLCAALAKRSTVF